MILDFLLLLACPLMMLICMKGMFKGSKEKDRSTGIQAVDKGNLKAIQQQMAELTEQNRRLAEEVNVLKDPANADEKVIRLEKERTSTSL